MPMREARDNLFHIQEPQQGFLQKKNPFAGNKCGYYSIARSSMILPGTPLIIDA